MSLTLLLCSPATRAQSGYPGGGSGGGYPGGGSPGGGGSGTLHGVAGAFYSVVLSNHVEISSIIGESWKKGAYDPNHGTSRYLNQRKADGSIEVDAGVAYQALGPRSPEGWGVTDLGFMASDPFGNSSFSWTAGGPGWINGQAV